MRKWFLVFVLLTIFLLPVVAKAQSVVSFSSVDVSVRPEYDTPTVLVIYKIALAPQTIFPVEITLRLPTTVQKPYTVAVGKSPKTVANQGVEYKFTPGADFGILTIKATDPYIQMEYYDPGLVKNGAQRQYVYEWLGDFPVDNFRFELREPLQSTNVKIAPLLTDLGVDEEGLHIGEFKQTEIKVGQKLSLTFSYQRDTDLPSTSFIPIQASGSLDQNIQGQSTLISYLPWALGGLGVVLLLIAGGVWAFGRTGRVVSRSRKRHSAVSEDLGDDDEQVYCAQCGKRAQPGDRFCRACGARIKRSEA